MPTSHSEALEVARSLGLNVRSAKRLEEGSDQIETFDLDDSFILRIGSTSRGEADLARERQVLPIVSRLVDLEVPIPTKSGRRNGRTVVAYQKIRGISGEAHRPDEPAWPELGRQLGSFLSRIHAIEPTGLPMAELDDVPTDLSRFGRVIERELGDQITDEMRRYLDGDFQIGPAIRSTFCHADIKGEHLILTPDGGKLVGVIDWGDSGVGDPAFDFAGLAIWLGPRFVRMVLEHYEPNQDERSFKRIVELARAGTLAGIGATLLGEDSWPMDLAVRQLQSAFART